MPAPQLARRRDIDGLRALAIALVVGYHAVPGLLRGGFVGVDVFFVISGYLISRILAADTEPGKFRRFYERRARRLLPALAVVLATTLALGYPLLLSQEFHRLARHALAAALFVVNLVLWRDSGYFDTDALEKPLLHLWSLGIEEQFYFVWPGLFWALLRRGARGALAATATLALASFGATVLVAEASPEAVFYLPWFRFWELLAGALVAQVPALGAAAQRSWRGLLVSMGGAGLVLAGAVLIDPGRPFPSWPALAPVLGAALLLWGGEHTWLGRVPLSARPVVGLGLISYPLYLWHWPLLSFQAELDPQVSAGERGRAVVLALLLSVVTYVGIEKPARVFYRRAPRAAVATLLATLAAVAAASALLQRIRPRWMQAEPPPTIAFLEEQRDLDTSLRGRFATRPCPADGDLPEAIARVCKASGPGPAPPIVLWGDSTAASWAPLVQDVAAERRQPAVVLSVSGCPPVVGVRSPFHDGCGFAETTAIADYVRELGPSHIVLTARWAAYSSPQRAHDESPPHFVTLASDGTATLESSRQALTRRLPETLRELTAIAPVIVIAAPADLVYSPFRALPRGLDYRPYSVEHLEAQAFTSSLLAEVERTGLPMVVIDPAARLCADVRCEGVLDGTLVYQDDNHVTAQGALLFREELAAALARGPSRRPTGAREADARGAARPLVSPARRGAR